MAFTFPDFQRTLDKIFFFSLPRRKKRGCNTQPLRTTPSQPQRENLQITRVRKVDPPSPKSPHMHRCLRHIRLSSRALDPLRHFFSSSSSRSSFSPRHWGRQAHGQAASKMSSQRDTRIRLGRGGKAMHVYATWGHSSKHHHRHACLIRHRPSVSNISRIYEPRGGPGPLRSSCLYVD